MPRKLTLLRYARESERILERMSAEATPFSEDAKAQKARLEACKADFLLWTRTYLPHYCTCGPAPMHAEWAALVHQVGDVVIAAPREFAKSVLFTLALPLWAALTRRRRFVIVISDTEDQAADFLEFAKLELEENPRLRQDYGDQVKAGFWETADFTTKAGVRFLARGKRQKVRGVRNRQYRPDLVIVDDFEDDQTVLNQKLTDKGFEWIQGAVKGALATPHQLIMLGQRLTNRCALSQAIEHEGWDAHVYSAEDDGGHSTWPQKFSDKDLQRKRRDMGTAVYSREYLNRPKPVGERIFREEWIKRYSPDWLRQYGPLPVYGFIDPSAKAAEHNDYKALIYVARTVDGLYPVIAAWVRHASFETLALKVYEDFARIRPVRLGCESNGFQAVLHDLFDAYGGRFGAMVPTQPVVHGTAKEFRISRMSPYVERGKILFPEGSDPDIALLIEQLLFYPDSGVHDDGPDALEGALALAEHDAFAFEYRSTGQRRAGLFEMRGYW